MEEDTAENGCKYGIIQLTDGSLDYLYGILSIHGALIRTKSKYIKNHKIMLMKSVPQEQIDLFHKLGIGTINVNTEAMDPYLTKFQFIYVCICVSVYVVQKVPFVCLYCLQFVCISQNRNCQTFTNCHGMNVTELIQANHVFF